MRAHVYRIAATALLTLLGGCASPSFSPELRSHALNIDANGGIRFGPALDAAPRAGGVGRESCETTLAGRELGLAIDTIVNGFRTHVEAGGKPEFAIFLHGGLVDAAGALRDSAELLAAMHEESFYPVFVNWETGILGSYRDYLFNVRRGQARPLEAMLTFPFVLLADGSRAIGRTPMYLARQLGEIRNYFRSDVEPVPVNWEFSAQIDDRPHARGWLRRAPSLAFQIFPGILRLLTTPLLDGIGEGAYQNMLRRTRVLFLLDGDFDATSRQECGAISRLMEALRAYEAELKGRPYTGGRNRGIDPVTRMRSLQAAHRPLSSSDIERAMTEHALIEVSEALAHDLNVVRIQIFAHSMGAIVANELLHRNRDLYFSDVVYMGAACSIKDFAALALPYLRDNPSTRFSNLTLHPENESFENSLYMTVPRGSLLEWIDTYLTDSKSELDRTLGSWNNIVRVLPIIDYLESGERKRLNVRGFGRTPGRPRKHGEFNDPPCTEECDDGAYPGARFWKQEFRDPR